MNSHPFLTTLKNAYELARGAIRLATLADENIIGLKSYKHHAFSSSLKTRKASRACVICVILSTSQRPTTQIVIAQTQIQLEDVTIKSVHIGSRKVSTGFRLSKMLSRALSLIGSYHPYLIILDSSILIENFIRTE